MMIEALLKPEQQMKEEMRKYKEDEAKDRGEQPPAAPAVDENAAAFTDCKGREHKGVLKIDATCADAEVRYPVDVDIIDDRCRLMDRFIRRICKATGISVTYTYYGKARNAYRYFQLHVRPIVRGKVSANVEFGAKIGVSIVEGYYSF